MAERHYASVQVLRGVAAGLVLVGHAVDIRHGMGMDGFATAFSTIFPAGVDIFFVISGFIITSTLIGAQPLSRCYAVEFAFRRFSRVYPLYWVVLIVSIGLSHWLAISATDFPMASPFALASLSTTANWFVPQAWTLSFEVYFYAAVTVLILVAPSRLFLWLALWLALQFIAAVLWTAYEVHTNALVMEFGLGCLICYLHHHKVPSFPTMALALSALLFFCGAFAASSEPLAGWWRVATYGLGAATLVYSAVALEQRGSRFSPILQYLGDASYSLYVWHLLFLLILMRSFDATGLIAATPLHVRPLLVVLWTAATYAWCLAAHHLLERPLLKSTRALRELFRRNWVRNTI
jgi:exopolysaccharide production protein ExoZ